MIGQTLGQYELLEEIGRGGMAVVYRARQKAVNRTVAVKVMFRSVAADANALARFNREAKLVAHLEHPHILPVYDYYAGGDQSYIVMRYLPTGTLREVMLRQRFSAPEAAFLLNQIASALDYAHRQGIVHRDIKPSNILLDADGNAFLSDFGIARMAESSQGLANTGIAVGTPGYMAPEQGLGSAIDSRADVYSLGVVVYEMLTGQMPFAGETPMAVILKHISEPIPDIMKANPGLPIAIGAVMQQALAKNPSDRYSTAGEFARAFQAALGTNQAIAPHKVQETTAKTIIELQDTEASFPVFQHVFVSYSKKDAQEQAELVKFLRANGHSVWFDEALRSRGGQSWWDVILEQIRATQVFIFALTPNSLASQPCIQEYSYAAALKKRIVPVVISTGTINYSMLPKALTQIQSVNFLASDGQRQLRESLENLNDNYAETPLPDPLPKPPSVPLSSIAELSDIIRYQNKLPDNPKEQFTLVAEMEMLLLSDKSQADEVYLLLELFVKGNTFPEARTKAQQLLSARRKSGFWPFGRR